MNLQISETMLHRGHYVHSSEFQFHFNGHYMFHTEILKSMRTCKNKMFVVFPLWVKAYIISRAFPMVEMNISRGPLDGTEALSLFCLRIGYVRFPFISQCKSLVPMVLQGLG